MAVIGALGEAIRYNEKVARGVASVTGSAVVTVLGGNPNATAPIIRQLTTVLATLVGTTAPADYIVTVGNIGSGGGNKANQFTIFVWKPTGGAAVVAVPAPGTEASITVGASPFTYTSTLETGEEVILSANGATASFTIKRGAFTSASRTLTSLNGQNVTLYNGDQIVLTYSAATPLMESLPHPAKVTVTDTAPLTLVAATDTVNVEWIAFGNLSAGQGF